VTYAVRFEGVSKRYRGGGPRYASLRHDAGQALRRLGQRLRGGRPEPRGTLALEDVSFEVEEGDSFAIIGPNGAGKTTALKIISRITYPTAGRVHVRGRVGALIEVGSGVHPELTARENIWLYGQILGLSRGDIRRRFDEIVDFAELANALDTPVKMYSSGMQLRLGFAIASHLEPDVFVVDEALAVGDAEFQRKCLAKMHEVGERSATILFVSHNTTALRAVCSRGMYVENGRVMSVGPTDAVIDEYLSAGAATHSPTSIQTEMFTIENVRIRSTDGGPPRTFDQAIVSVALRARRRIVEPGLYLGFLSADDYRLAGLDLRDFASVPPLAPGQAVDLEFVIDRLPFMPGSYAIEMHTKDSTIPQVEFVQERFPFHVMDAPIYGGRGLDGWFGRVGLSARATVLQHR
jgi:lipopolysaccharide transport system ATP-binding protein